MCEKNVQCTLNIGIDKFLCCENSLMLVFATGKKQKVGGLIRGGKKMGDIESANGLKAKYKNCKNCGCSFRLGKGVNSKGKRFTPVGIIIGICTLGIQFRYPIFSLQKYCSRECWRADTQN